VRISATLMATGNAWPVTAYLTTKTGPAATTADEIARATVTIPFGSEYTSVMLLNVPHLAAGTYYLTLDPAGGEGCTPELNCNPLAWAGTSSASVTTVPGVIFNGSFFTPSNPGPGVAAYPPASYFNVDTTGSFLFNVTTQ
jgi:hypothetical protein